MFLNIVQLTFAPKVHAISFSCLPIVVRAVFKMTKLSNFVLLIVNFNQYRGCSTGFPASGTDNGPCKLMFGCSVSPYLIFSLIIFETLDFLVITVLDNYNFNSIAIKSNLYSTQQGQIIFFYKIYRWLWNDL